MIGTALVLSVAAVLFGVWGLSGLIPGLVFGTLALVIEVVSVKLLRGALPGPFKETARQFAIGAALKLAGVSLFVVAVLVRRDLFQPLPTAFAFVGVLIPLLFLEPRFLK